MMDQGVNLLDTAPAYGKGYAEELVGEAIRGRDRGDIVISTKGGLKIDDPAGGIKKIASREEMINGCEASLRRLGIDYADILFIHWPDVNTPIEETLGAMNDLKAQGKIRHIGLSNFSVQQMEEAAKYADIGAIQPPFSMVVQSAVDIMKWAEERNIGCMTYGSLGAGILGGKIRELTDYGKGDVRGGFYDFFKEPKFSKVMELLKVMDAIADDRGVTHAQIAINWVVQKSYAQTALVGVRTPAHAEENCGASEWRLSDEELALLDTESGKLFG
jgi:aryl-alcohol dehydrogenase-like predicted oxidoreductase